MKFEAIATGATLDEARENAVRELNAPEGADVHTEIVAYPQKKILGLFGGSPAKAKAFYEVPDAPVKAEPAKKAAPKAEKKPAAQKTAPAKKEEAPAEEKKAVETVKTAINTDESESLKSAAAYLREILSGMGVGEVKIEAFRTQDNEVILELDCGEDYGIVIGRRGETLDSIQYLTRLVANKTKKDGEYSRISINVGNYREKRNNALRELARKNSEKVLKYGRNVTFEPMNPYERRIIHTAVQEIEGVSSHSVGSDSGRRVVITLAEGVKPTHPSKGGYGRGRGGRGGYGRGGRGRSNSAPAEAPARAPRTDAGAEKVSLYGKIN
ncbi:MAG: KH domain-containing protein [Ruminococcaceae bacterium]|nr:KH domain-containing protein [Oscillospiraceae bacterium]